MFCPVILTCFRTTIARGARSKSSATLPISIGGVLSLLVEIEHDWLMIDCFKTTPSYGIGSTSSPKYLRGSRDVVTMGLNERRRQGQGSQSQIVEMHCWKLFREARKMRFRKPGRTERTDQGDQQAQTNDEARRGAVRKRESCLPDDSKKSVDACIYIFSLPQKQADAKCCTSHPSLHSRHARMGHWRTGSAGSRVCRVDLFLAKQKSHIPRGT